MSQLAARLSGVLIALYSLTAAAQSEYVSIEMEIDIDRPAGEVWSKVGGFCDIEQWMGLPCEITAGSGGIGSVRSLLGGRITEVLVGQTELSYGYAMPPSEGQFYDLYHGFMEARPITESSSKMVYTLMLDVSNLADQAAKDAEVERRRTMFTTSETAVMSSNWIRSRCSNTGM